MRRIASLVVLAVAVLMSVSAVSAQVIPLNGNSWSFPIYVDTNSSIPAGRITIYFSDRDGGSPQYAYLGNSKNIVVPAGNPAFKFCIAKIDLTGPQYTNQRVDSDWGHRVGNCVGNDISNVFSSEVGVGEQEAIFTIYGKQKKRLHILFFSFGIGSKTISTDEGFRVFAQDQSVGMSDYTTEVEYAKAVWPSLSQTEAELYARTWVFDKYYRTQGLIPFGTELSPIASAEGLKDRFEWKQKKADEALKQKQDADRQAQQQLERRIRDEAIAAAKAEAERQKVAAQTAQSTLEASRIVPWTFKLPSVSNWAVWVDGDYPMIVNGDTVNLTGRLGTHWVEFVPAGEDFQSWHKCKVTQMGQQILFTEVQ